MDLVKEKILNKVLIIEDEEDLSFLLKLICEMKGLTVSIANNLKEARTQLSNDPDLIFLDNKLPDGLGLEFIDTIRENTHDCFVVMMTAENFDNFQKKVFQSGFNYFLVKPFNIDTVARLIENRV
jgi:two-component system, OmpR family, response regulator